MITIGYTKKMVMVKQNNKIDYRLFPDNVYEEQFINQDLTSLDIFKNDNNKYDTYDDKNESILDYSLSNFITNESL